MPNGQTGPADEYRTRFGELRAKLVDSLGTDTVDLVLERAVREVSNVYPGFSLHRNDAGNVELEWRDDPVAEHSEDYVRSAFSALYAATLILLAKLLGKEIAIRLAASLDADSVLQGSQIAPA